MGFDICVYDLIDSTIIDGIYYYKYKLSFGITESEALSGTAKIGEIKFYGPVTSFDGEVNLEIIEEESQLLDYQNNSIPISGVRGGTIVYE